MYDYDFRASAYPSLLDRNMFLTKAPKIGIASDPLKWMKCPHCGVRNRTDHKTVLTCECCGGNLEANTI